MHYSASIIIPTYHRETLIKTTLKHLYDRIKTNVEILVVHQNKDNHELAIWIQENTPEVRYFNTKKWGLPWARNYGIKQSTGDIIIFCDDDVLVLDGFVEAHLNNYENSEVGGVVGRVLLTEPNNKQGRKKVTGRINLITGSMVDNFQSEIKQTVQQGQGCNFSFRKDILERTGGFDVRFGGSAFLEDTDMCLNVKEMGLQLVYEPKATLVHLKESKGGCRVKNVENWYYWYAHNFMLLFLKHFKRRYLGIFLLFRLANIVSGTFLYKNPGVLISGIKGLLQGYKDFKNESEANWLPYKESVVCDQ